MAQGRVTLTPADFVEAATAYVNEHGLESLTMRSLGEQLGVDPTALYRHFPSKDALLTAMLDDMMGRILAVDVGVDLPPRERIRAMLLGARQVFCECPNLVGAFITSAGQMPNGFEVMRRGIAVLEEMGLRDDDLVHAMQMLEGYVIGASVFDLAGAPHHLEVRRLRYRAVEHPAYDALSRDTTDVRTSAEVAFAHGLEGLLDVCERLATTVSAGH